MRISELDGRIDRRCVIAIKQQDGVFKLLSKNNTVVPTYIFSEDGKLFLQLFFPKTIFSKEQISRTFSQSDLQEKRSYYSVAERINNVTGMKEIGRIFELPSVVVNNSYLLGDEVYIDFRFHSSQRQQVNKILAKFVIPIGNFRLIELSTPNTMRGRLDLIHNQTPVSLIRFSIPNSIDDPVLQYISKHDPDAVVEVENRSLNGKGLKVLVHLSRKLEDGVPNSREITPFVFETYVDNKILIEARKRANDHRIPRIAFFLSIEGNCLIDTTFVPTSLADEYLDIMMSMTDFTKDIPISLDYFSDLRESVWEWL
ncbi:MAG: hypothetical protein M1148_03500 [Candidatus Thermoplasmatota archaeon]|nr:hypothetical protein [Candidatus Thermoplasmatota archaeon]MCL5438244.1 hypothetical protein [Candidatus Thermoplasmatota archaeon]